MLARLNSSDEDLVGRTVLLVDDDPRNIFALSSALERRGMNVLTATDRRRSDRADRADRRRSPSSLMDIMMPEMDGLPDHPRGSVKNRAIAGCLSLP